MPAAITRKITYNHTLKLIKELSIKNTKTPTFNFFHIGKQELYLQ